MSVLSRFLFPNRRIGFRDLLDPDQTTTSNFYLARLDGALASSFARYRERESQKGQNYVRMEGGREWKGSTGTDKTFIVRRGEQSVTINAHADTSACRAEFVQFVARTNHLR